MAKPQRRRSCWNMFMSCHQALYADLERSGYNNLTDQEKLDWNRCLSLLAAATSGSDRRQYEAGDYCAGGRPTC